MLLPNFRHTRKTGFTLLETVAAVGFAGTFIAILILVSSNVLGMLRTSRDNIAASQNLQQRVEELRMASWGELTTASRLASEIFAVPTGSLQGLAEPVETVIVTPYPAKTPYTPARVVSKNGVATVVSSNVALKNEPMIRVDITLTWKGFPKKRNRERTASVLIANKASEQ